MALFAKPAIDFGDLITGTIGAIRAFTGEEHGQRPAQL